MSDSEAELHYFSDWGVVTYRSGSITDSTSTFVSFKSGKLHGRAVYDSVHAAGGPDAVRTAWRHFNAGHEHPDQNSFTFSPAGRRLITDGLYGPKLTYLNNVLMLAPGDASACTRPWTGQLGDCDRWLRWTGAEDGRSHGQVVAAQTVHDVVFVAGEAVGAYHDSLLLSSVRRSLVLLKPDLLVVTDDIRLLPGSHVTHVSVFFNNHERPFRSAVHSMFRPPLSGVQMVFDDGLYGVMWTSAAGQSPPADVMLRNYSSSRGLLHTSNVNVTYAMEGRHTRLVHVIYGPQAKPTSLHVVGDTVRITTAQDTYNVTVQSNDTVSSPLCSVTSLHDTVTFYPSKPQTGPSTDPHTRPSSDDTHYHMNNTHSRWAHETRPPHEPQSPLHEPQSPLHEPQSPLYEPQSPLHEPQYSLHEQQHPLHERSDQSGHMSFVLWSLGGTVVTVVYCKCRFSPKHKVFLYSLVFLSLFSLSLYIH